MQAKVGHCRAPVIVEAEHFDVWLDPAMDARLLEPLLAPYAGGLAIEPVSKAVNSPRNDGEKLLLTIK